MLSARNCGKTGKRGGGGGLGESDPGVAVVSSWHFLKDRVMELALFL